MYSVNQAKINYNKDNNFLIFGSGTIGLLIGEVLKSYGFKKITIVDEINYRINFAKKKLKANILNPRKEIFHGNFNDSFDVIFDTITNDWSFSLTQFC